MSFERAPYLSYADIPIVYVIELGGEEFLGIRDYKGDFQQISSLAEIPDTDWQPVEMFGPSLGLLTPCSADITNDAGDAIGRIGIRIEDGKPGCTSIFARPGEILTGALLRQIPLGRLVREAAMSQTVRVLMMNGKPFGARYVEGGPGFGQLLEDLRRELAAVDEKARRRVIDDSFLRMVAHIYRTALRLGIPPAKHVEEMLGPVTPASARRWIAAARRAGFLGPAPARGRAGELTHVESVSS